MLDPVVLNTLQQQIARERQNETAYLTLANALEVLNLDGFAKFMHDAASEEAEHARKFTAYVIDRNAAPITLPLQAATAPLADMLTAGAVYFQAALDLEIANTTAIKVLYDMAEEVHDSQTCVWLIWAIEEQTKAERELTQLTARATFAQGCAAAILAMDHELGEGEK